MDRAARPCGPCKDTECLKVVGEDDGDEADDSEFAALTDLYNRLFKKCGAAATEDSSGAGRAKRDVEACRCEQQQADDAPPPPPVKRSPVEYCAELAADGSPVKRGDRQLTALLRRRPVKDGGDDTGGGGGGGGAETDADEGDVKHLTAKLPLFRSCKSRKPGAVNATLLGLDLEQWMTTGTAGDGRDDDVRRAAYHLAAAEAQCKYAGAVQAAELAVTVEPAEHLAEVAARFGARSYMDGGRGGRGAGRDAGGDSPVTIVAYVGNTGYPSHD